MSIPLLQSTWIDGHCRKICLRRKAINEVVDWLQSVIKNDNDFNNESSGREDIYDLFLYIQKVMINNEMSEDDIEF